MSQRKRIRRRLSDLYRPQVLLVEDRIDSMLGLKKDADKDEQEAEGKRRRRVAEAS